MEKIVFLDQGTLPTPLRKPAFAHEWVNFDRTSPEETAERLRDATLAITNKVKIHEPELQAAPKLKMIAVAATGYDCVDVSACAKRNIAVANVPGYTGDSVPEHTFMLLLALRRNLIPYSKLVQQGAWQKAPHFVLQDYEIENVSGSTLGLIGYGRLAQAVEARARAFGMKILISERKGASTVRAGRTAFSDVLKTADVVSIHSPMTPETRGMIGAPELAMMKKTAILINTARGGLVDEAALAAALQSGKLGGAGIDVLTEEPPRHGNPLLDLHLPNLIVTPHLAWSSRQSLTVLADEIVSNLDAFVGGNPRNLLTGMVSKR